MKRGEVVYTVVRFQVPGLHYWGDKVERDKLGVGYLGSPHRHLFHFEVRIEELGDREVEYMTLKAQLEQQYRRADGKPVDFGGMSCEKIAMELKGFLADDYYKRWGTFKRMYVSVFEDDENGAIVQDEWEAE